MDELQALLAQFTALDAALYVMVFPSALLLRFARSYWHGFGNRATLGAAGVFSLLGTLAAAVDAPEPRAMLWLLVQFISLIVAVLVGEAGSRKIPWLPQDDQIADVRHLMPQPPKDGP